MTTPTPGSLKARLIAFYLPQYHPIPENDLWWCKGFTEWTNVTRAKPLFPGHRQPNLPGDLGFYDLRVPEVRQAQADLARTCGIEGFCYWHYWFGKGRRLLDRVFDEVLESGKPDFPFCLAWANETWSRVWHGQEFHAKKDFAGQLQQTWNRVWRGQDFHVLMEQTYPGEEDHRNHFKFLLKAFRDPRYIRVDGMPLFVIYLPMDLPNSKEVIALWRKLALEAGLPGLFVAGVCSDGIPLEPLGLDARIPPQPETLWYLQKTGSPAPATRPPLVSRIWNRVRTKLPFPRISSYKQKVEWLVKLPPCDAKTIPCPLPNWDNTPRCGTRGHLFPDATPELYRKMLRKAIADVAGRPPDRRLVFLKSWNEWAEGNYLEPDQRHGHEFLKVTGEEALVAGKT